MHFYIDGRVLLSLHAAAHFGAEQRDRATLVSWAACVPTAQPPLFQQRCHKQ